MSFAFVFPGQGSQSVGMLGALAAADPSVRGTLEEASAVLGFDPERQKQQLKDRIGVCLQATNLPAKIRTYEALELFGSLYTRNLSSEQLLKRLQLWEKRNAFYETLSGGQKQRLALALALVNDPQLLFLDEPTTGLDPQIRLEIHNLVEELKAEKRTVVLTTHYIEEAERLCDRVAIVDHGRVIALGSPRELMESIDVSHLPPPEPRKTSATLEDVFVVLTGRHLRDE